MSNFIQADRIQRAQGGMNIGESRRYAHCWRGLPIGGWLIYKPGGKPVQPRPRGVFLWGSIYRCVIRGDDGRVRAECWQHVSIPKQDTLPALTREQASEIEGHIEAIAPAAYSLWWVRQLRAKELEDRDRIIRAFEKIAERRCAALAKHFEMTPA